MGTTRVVRAFTVASLATVALATGCARTTGSEPTPTLSVSASSPSVDPSAAAVEEAIAGYYAARQVEAAVLADPKPTLADYPAELEITKHYTGTALTNLVDGAKSMATNEIKTVVVMAGNRPKVSAVDLAAGSIVLTHCPTDEKETTTVKGKEASTGAAPGNAPPPHLVTYTMQRSGKPSDGWLLSNLIVDVKRTCAADA